MVAANYEHMNSKVRWAPPEFKERDLDPVNYSLVEKPNVTKPNIQQNQPKPISQALEL